MTGGLPISMRANTVQAKINLYKSIDGNCIPSAITGRVNKGINPKVDEDNKPYTNPVTVSLVILVVHII